MTLIGKSSFLDVAQRGACLVKERRTLKNEDSPLVAGEYHVL